MDRLLPILSSESAVPSHALEPSAVHRADVAGRTPVVYRIAITEKTGRFEQR